MGTLLQHPNLKDPRGIKIVAFPKIVSTRNPFEQCESTEMLLQMSETILRQIQQLIAVFRNRLLRRRPDRLLKPRRILLFEQ